MALRRYKEMLAEFFGPEFDILSSGMSHDYPIAVMINAFFVVRYIKKVQADPSASLCAHDPNVVKFSGEFVPVELTTRKMCIRDSSNTALSVSYVNRISSSFTW